MSLNRLVLILPLAMCLLTLALWGVATFEPHPQTGEIGFTPTPVMISYAISAPAFLVKIPVVPFRGTKYLPMKPGYFNPENLVFLVGVFILWHLVGRAIQRHRLGITTPNSRPSTRSIIWQVFLIGVGTIFVGAGTEGVLTRWYVPQVGEKVKII